MTCAASYQLQHGQGHLNFELDENVSRDVLAKVLYPKPSVDC